MILQIIAKLFFQKISRNIVVASRTLKFATGKAANVLSEIFSLAKKNREQLWGRVI